MIDDEFNCYLIKILIVGEMATSGDFFHHGLVFMPESIKKHEKNESNVDSTPLSFYLFWICIFGNLIIHYFY
jgi:hypothetical protein